MEYICLNCGHISNSLKCPICEYTVAKNDYSSVMKSAQESIRFGYYYRREAEKNLNVHANLLSPTNYLEWIATAILAGISYDILKYLALRIYNYAKDKIGPTQKEYSEILDILSNEEKLQEFIRYVKEYNEGLIQLDDKQKKYIAEEKRADFMGKKAGELWKRENRILTVEDYRSFIKEMQQSEEVMIKPKKQIKAFMEIKEE